MKNTRFISFLLLSAAFVLASCGGGTPSSKTESSTPSHATGLTTDPTPSSEEGPETSGDESGEDESSEPGEGESSEPGEGESSESEPVTAVSYYVAGSFNGWTGKDENYIMTLADEQIEGKDAYVSPKIPMKAGVVFKVMDSNNKWYPDGMGNDSKITENGDYVITFVPEGGMVGDEWNEGYHKFEKVGEYSGEVTETIYYLSGGFNGWKQKDEDYVLAKTDEQKDGKDQYAIEVNFEAATELKVMSSDNLWYPNNNVAVSAGEHKVYFVPEGGITGWTDGCVFVA